MNLQIGQESFKKDFLGGHGNLQLDFDGGGLDPDQPFSPAVIQPVKVGATVASSLEFGRTDDLACTVDFSAAAHSAVELIWPGKPSEFLNHHKLGDVPAGKVGAHFSFNGSASGDFEGTMPLGPAGFSFGIAAGGGVGYDRYLIYDAGTSAKGLLTDLITGVRLPQHCDTAEKIPGPGEVLAFRYNGFLEMTAGLSWGYQFTGHQGIDYHQLHAVAEYDVRLKAAAKFGYKLGGEYSIEAQAGHAPNWIRVAVRKKRDRQFDFAASFDFLGKTNLTGIPESADDFLIAVLGADAKSALDLFAKVRKFSDLKTLEAEAGKMLIGRLQGLSHQWLGKALDNETVGEFISVIDRVVTEYEGLEQTISAKLAQAIHLYEDYLGEGKLKVLEGALEKVASLSTREGLQNLSDADAWAVINRLVGGDLFKLLRGNQAFAELTGTAKTALDFLQGNFQPQVRDMVHEWKTAFGLEAIFGQLKSFSSKDKLITLADEKLQGVVEKLLGIAWSQINKSSVATHAQQLKKALDEAEKFKNVWFNRITAAANQSFSLQVNYAYTRAAHDDVLIDVEVDLAAALGPTLFSAATHGKFVQVFENPNSPALLVHEGILTHTLTKSSHLSINVFGWEAKNLTEVMSKTENAIQAGPTGNIQIFTTEAAIKQSRQRSRETVESNFLMQFTGEAFSPEGNSSDRDMLIRAINTMGCEYDLMITDDRTKMDELLDYLTLAERVGLVPSAAGYRDQLKAQFGEAALKVRARYVVAFDNDGVRDAFNLPTDKVKTLARDITRDLVRAQIVTGRPITHDLTVIGMLYLTPEVQQVFAKEGFTAILAGHWSVTVHGVQRTLPQNLNPLLNRLLQMEARVVKQAGLLDEIVDRARKGPKPVPESELEKAAREFVESAVDLNDLGEGVSRINSFFAVFDALVNAASNGKGYRESSMLLEIETEKGVKVPKYLMSGPGGAVEPAPLALAAAADHHQ